MKIIEIFHSIQGESSQTGKRFTFIRTAGCNLNCTYCDSRYAHGTGQEMSIDDIMSSITDFKCPDVLLTGGEPLLQPDIGRLIERLHHNNYTVSIETNGETPIPPEAKKARIIMDIKTPGSGVNAQKFHKNIKHLKHGDEVKFALTSSADYEWASKIINSGELDKVEILLSPVQPGLSPRWLAEQILKDKLNVRFQLQLHRIIWPDIERGV
jgi:7-carboxy-7-deazaguanine synthase